MSHDPDSRTALPRPGGPRDLDSRIDAHHHETVDHDDGSHGRAIHPATATDAEPDAAEEAASAPSAARLGTRGASPAASKTTG